MNAIGNLKNKARAGIEVGLNIAGLLASVSGATVAAVFGKFVMGVVLGALALGFVLRLKVRRPVAAADSRVPAWLRPVVATLSAAEAAVLVEATNLPVRFGQEGFQYGHWALVGLVVAALYLLQAGVFKRLAVRRRGAGAA